MGRHAVLAPVGMVVILSLASCTGPSRAIDTEEPPIAVTVAESSPAWSPDGTRIAFHLPPVHWGDSTGIVVMRRDGTERRLLVDGDWPAWRPDGTELAFVRDTQIYVINLFTGSVRQVTRACENHFPSWSPDGTRLAFSRTVPYDSLGIWLCDPANGGQQQRICEYGWDPSWSPDGERIVFFWWTPSGWEDLYLLRLEDGSVEQLTNTRRVREMGPVWARDGLRIVYSTEIGIGVYSVAARRCWMIPDTGDPGIKDYVFPDIGPDSQTIVYNKRYLWTVKVDGTENRPLGPASK